MRCAVKIRLYVLPRSVARAGRLPYAHAGLGSDYSAVKRFTVGVLLSFNNGTARAEGRKNEAWDLRHVTRTREGSTEVGTSLEVYVFSCAPLEVPPLVCIRGSYGARQSARRDFLSSAVCCVARKRKQ